MSFYFMMMLGVNKPTGAVIFDLPRFWLACISTMMSSHTSVVILFIFFYTQNHENYLDLLNMGFVLHGYYIFFAARKPIAKWMQQQ